jgi:uncharacterized protein (TIGR02217 family)
VSFLVGVRLPEEIERGALGGPEYRTTVLSLDSGFEFRNSDWLDARGKWDLGYGLLEKFQEDPDGAELDLDTLINFFQTCRGKGRSFRFKDFSDYEIGMRQGVDLADPQTIGLGDGTTTVFQVFKRYQIAGNATTQDNVLTKLVGSTVRVYLDGVLQTLTTHYTVDEDRGTITMVTPPAASGGTGPGGVQLLGLRCEYDRHVRFDTDKLDVNMELFSAGSWPNFPIVELRDNGVDG